MMSRISALAAKSPPQPLPTRGRGLTEQAFAVRELTCNRAAVSHARWNSPLIETDLRHALHSQSGKAGAAGRETPIGPYIADFAWLSARIIVEVDGDSHETLDGRRHDVRR